MSELSEGLYTFNPNKMNVCYIMDYADNLIEGTNLLISKIYIYKDHKGSHGELSLSLSSLSGPAIRRVSSMWSCVKLIPKLLTRSETEDERTGCRVLNCRKDGCSSCRNQDHPH